QGNNTFVDAPELADGVTHTLYVNIKDPTGDCTRSVPWKLTIDDTTPPTFTCPSDRTVDVAAGNCQGVVPDFSTIIADAADNCGNAVIGQDVPANSTFGSGEGDQVVVTITADDGNGNVNTTPCQVTLTVKDNEAPSLSCPTSINVNNDSGQCNAVVNFTVTATDNCDGSLAVTLNQNSGTLFNVGTTTVNASATDAGGNTGNCSFDVIVKDNEAPTATCNDVTVTLGSNGEVALNPLSSGAITNRNDNCGVTGTVGSSQVIFTCDDLGSNAETILNVDVNGNSTTCDITVTVEDPNSFCNQPPVAKCQNLTVSTALNTCAASITPAQINNNSSDPDNDPLQLSLDNSGPFAPGTYTVELSVSDGSLSDQCTASVLVNDTQAPTISCPGTQTEFLDASCEVLIPDYTGLATASDNCGALSISQSPPAGTVIQAPITVTLSAQDNAGLTTSCTFTVEPKDAISPDVVCPADITVSNDPGLCSAVVDFSPASASDNCDNNLDISYSQDPGTAFEVGTTTVTITVKDDFDNPDDCSFSVTVNDTEVPTFSNCPTNINLFNDFRECGAIVTWTPPVFEDNCPDATFNSSHQSGDFFSVGTTTVSYSGLDKAGNQAIECSFNVSITDNEKPRIACPGDVSTGTDEGVCGAEVKLITPIVTDNCQAAEVRARYRPVDENGGSLGSWTSRVADPSGFFSVGRYEIQWRVVDLYGNKETCSDYLTVFDTEDPLAVCKDLTVDFNGQEDISLTVDQVWNEAASSDNCGFVEFVSANLTIACEDLGNTVAIPVTIKDVTGNTDVCTSYVEVIGLPCDWVEGPSDGSLNCDGQTTSDYDPDEASFTLTSAGCWQSNQNPDQAAFVYQELCGDGSLTAEVSAVNSGGYVGLMARESLDPLARRAGVLKNNSTRRVRREWRPLYDGPVVRTSSNRSRVKWLRIVRQGDQIKSYTSTNGFSWRLLYKVNFSDLEECIYVGMMAYSLNGGTEVEGVFENVSLSGSGTLAGGIVGDPSSITPEGLHAWGTAGNIGNGTIDIFPNPASDQTQLVLEDFQDEPAQLMVRDAFGKLVRQIDLNSASGLSMPLDLNNLTPGVYIISLIQDQQLMGSKRLVVQP
ncbi:MAG: HYR domain-containing protein, partial [Cyanothece sp. SIO1E1]|nr:HYR domain-containing protein [Cyanothece sp. SIO1E1]